MIFYVYEHWRPDKDICFYVGKGSHGRSADLKRGRNRHHKAIQRKLSAQGMCVEIRLVESGISEQCAFDLEMQRIAFWRSVGVALANRTDGGEGGKGRILTPEVRTRMSDAQKKSFERAHIRDPAILRMKAAAEARKGVPKINSPETRANMSIARKGMVFSEQHRANLAARKLGKARKPFTEETRAKMRAASLAREEAKRLKFGDAVRRTSRLLEPT